MSPIARRRNSTHGNTGVAHFEVRTLEELDAARGRSRCAGGVGPVAQRLLASAPELRFVQSFSAGTDQYDKALFAKAGVRLANAQGVNERAVAEHAMALILALTRQLHHARDNQRERRWRGMIGDRALREQELGGKTLASSASAASAARLARLARAFDMRVIGVRRTARPAPDAADDVAGQAESRAGARRGRRRRLDLPADVRDRRPHRRRGASCVEARRAPDQCRAGKVVDEPALLAALRRRTGRRRGARLLPRRAAAAPNPRSGRCRTC